MRFTSTLTLGVLLASTTIEAVHIGGWFKNALGLIPGSLTKSSGSEVDNAKNFINEWDGKKDIQGKEFRMRHYRKYYKKKDPFTPIFVNNNSYHSIAGTYVQRDCNGNAVDTNKVKETLNKSLLDAKIYVIRCGDNVSTESM